VRLLIVEDEPRLADNIARSVRESAAYAVDVVNDGEAGLRAIESNPYDAVILDLMLPKLDGMQVLERMRQAGRRTPVLVLTARDDKESVIALLNAGADDYLTKPFNPRELVARVKAILRRSERSVKVADTSPIHLGDLTIDPASREVRLYSRILDLRTQEFDLLLTFVEHRGRVLSREQLLQKAWGFDFYGQTRTVDVHVAHLRKKLEESSVKIETVTGVGYKLIVSP
jgi:DNA-binding response OmpR family regulator